MFGCWLSTSLVNEYRTQGQIHSDTEEGIQERSITGSWLVSCSSAIKKTTDSWISIIKVNDQTKGVLRWWEKLLLAGNSGHTQAQKARCQTQLVPR